MESKNRFIRIKQFIINLDLVSQIHIAIPRKGETSTSGYGLTLIYKSGDNEMIGFNNSTELNEVVDQIERILNIK